MFGFLVQRFADQSGEPLQPLRGSRVHQFVQDDPHRERWMRFAVGKTQGRLDFIQPGHQLPRIFLFLLGRPDVPADILRQHRLDIFAQVLLLEDPFAHIVDFAALLVQHVVVFEQMLADVEVRAFHPGLGLLDHPADKAGFHRHGVVDVHALHHPRHLVSAEPAHQVVFHREEEARGTGIPLAAGAPAQLVVDAPRLVAFRSEHVQAAELAHLLFFAHVLAEELHLRGVDPDLFGGGGFEQAQPLGVDQVVRILHARCAAGCG